MDGTPGSNGNPVEAANWQQQFLADTDLADNQTLSRFSDVPSLAKAYVEARSMMGQKKAIPAAEAPEEEWQKFYGELGRPAEPAGYELAKPELPAEFPYSPELETAYRNLAHQAGLNPKQAQILYDGWIKTNLELHQQASSQQQQTLEEIRGGLQKKWGDKFEGNLAMAQKAQKAFAPEGSEGLAALDEILGNDPRLIELFYNIGSKMGEAALVTAGTAGAAGTLESKRQELLRHPAYMDRKHPEHRAVVEQVNQVYEQLYPAVEEK